MLEKLTHEAVVGEGYFAHVARYKSDDGTKYAVKKLKEKNREDEIDVRRFKREIEILKLLKDEPYIVPLIDFSEEELWYIMPYAEENLYKYITTNNQKLTTEERIEIFENILDGISIAHSKSILHRDISPNNILKIQDDWYICDFGLGKDYSKYTKGGYSSVQGYGSYNYVAPEQFNKLSDATIQSDVYSLGKILFFILKGKEPRDIDDAPPIYKAVIKSAAAERVEDRYQSVAILKQELNKYKILYSRLHRSDLTQKTVQEYISDMVEYDSDEFFEIILKANIDEHVYYDYIEPIIDYFDTVSKISRFTSEIGNDKTLEFLKKFVEKLHECYSKVGWPFSSLNSFGYFLNRVYKACYEKPLVRLECLKEIWEIAVFHDQWAIQDLIVEIISTNQIDSDIEEEFALHILKMDKDFVKINKIRVSQINSTVIKQAIRELKTNSKE